ncbi:MAG: GNAT family N-acetyltransferase [Kangiellaceae bacterium]|nr:GNAT family N-acetyltransferase [Kangiellaceae bacterium]
MTATEINNKAELTYRIAGEKDVPSIIELMQVSIAENMKSFLTKQEIEAAKETMGVDQTLIQDGTYFIIETEVAGRTILVGCGGWGKRKTLYGGDHTVGRDDALSDPSTEPARIRAMYTHPDWTRNGIGGLLLTLGENAAREAGFRTIELGATLAGEPLYVAKGFKEVNRETFIAANGSDNVVIKMSKTLYKEPAEWIRGS